MRALDFFAGSGLVRLGLEPEFTTIWANDHSATKAAVYNANHPERPLHLAPIEGVDGSTLPKSDLAWASFPCQDLSLAGNLSGIRKGTRSGLFWEWMRVLDELTAAGKQPPVLVAENVVGFLSAHGGANFRRAYRALKERGYRAGAVVVDAKLFVPQSRPRAFLIAAREHIPLKGLTGNGAASFHTETALRTAREAVQDRDWVWWSLPAPSGNVAGFADICERDAPCESAAKTADLRAMLSRQNLAKLDAAIAAGRFLAGTGYKRTRLGDDGGKAQRFEIRFDGVAGCLRTPEGGSSRQVAVIVERGKVRTRLLTVRECARLMGAPDTYNIPGSYNEGYHAMGDAVAVPVVRWLTRHLLAPLGRRARRARAAPESWCSGPGWREARS